MVGLGALLTFMQIRSEYFISTLNHVSVVNIMLSVSVSKPK